MQRERTLIERFQLWKKNNPTGSEADFHSAIIAARKKHSITPSIVTTTDGTATLRMSFEERQHFLEENKEISFPQVL